MAKRQRFEMQATDIGRRRVQSLDFAAMISDMMKEGAPPDDLFFRTAVLMCTDENDEIQMTHSRSHSLHQFALNRNQGRNFPSD
jgi:hypothetical protein